MNKLVDDLKNIASKITEGGPRKARDRHVSKGKLLPRERINALIDKGSPFLELGQFAAYNMYEDSVPSAGMITGIGKVEGYDQF